MLNDEFFSLSQHYELMIHHMKESFFDFGFHSSKYCSKFLSITSNATETDVEAPGDSPSKAMIEWSLESTTSVPNWMNPLPSFHHL